MKVAHLLEAQTEEQLKYNNFIMKLIYKEVKKTHPEAELFTDSKHGRHFIGISIQPKGVPKGVYTQGTEYIQADSRHGTDAIWVTGGNKMRYTSSFQRPKNVVAELNKRIAAAKKIAGLTESEEETSNSATLVGALLLKLYRAGKPLKVMLTGLKETHRTQTGKYVSTPIEDDEWNITKVELLRMVSTGKYEVRVHNDSPEKWFELLPEDDGKLTIKKKDGYWLLTSQDGKGVKI